MLPFDMQGTVSYYCATVTLSLRHAVLRYSTFKNVVTVKSGSEVRSSTRIDPPPDILETLEATISLSRTVSEIEGDSVENRKIFSPPYI